MFYCCEKLRVQADRAANFVFSKLNIGIGLLLGLLSIIVRFLFFNYQSVPAILCLIWGLAGMCTYNISVTKRMMWSFMFWFKMYNWIIFITCYAFLVRVNLAIEGCNFITGTLIVAAGATHDGWHVRPVYKLGFCVIIVTCLLLMCGFVYFEGKIPLVENVDGVQTFQDQDIKIFGQTIGLRATALGAITNLLIFFSEQVWNIARYKERSGVIQARPKIQWIDDWEGYTRQVSASRATIHNSLLTQIATEFHLGCDPGMRLDMGGFSARL